MLSVIVIGRNESENLYQCLESAKILLDSHDKVDGEIIYVDSDSSDNSIDIAKKNCVDRIIKLQAYFNAAVARNVGAQYAKHPLLLFVDADMILKNFDIEKLTALLTERNIIAGKLVEKLVNKSGTVYESYVRKYPKNLYGGIFLISKSNYFKIGGMDEKMTKGQDYDFFIQALKHGLEMKVSDEVLCQHRTLPYRSKDRVRETTQLHSKYRAYLLRKNIDELISFKLIFMEYYPLILSLLVIVLAMAFASLKLLFSSFLIFLIGCIWKVRNQFNLSTLMHEALGEIIFLKSIFIFSPAEKETKIVNIK